MANLKITELSADTAPTSEDLIVTVNDPGGSPANRKVTIANLFANNKLSALASTSSVELAGVISDETGSGGLVFANTPTLVTPILGVATATSINALTPTALATGFSVAGGTTPKTLTVDQTISVSELMNLFYGVSWDESADTYVRTGRTAGQAIGVTLADAFLSVHRRVRRCLLQDAGTVNYHLSATDTTKKEDGSTASDLTGTDGQVMVQIPKFWYRYGYSGTTHTWEISPVPLAGFDVHPAFVKDGVEVAYRYIGAYEGILYDTSITAYVDGIHQTAVSAVFATADDSITIATRSGWATNLTVGQRLVVTGTVSNNATLTVASVVSGTAITVSENLTDETAASTVISTDRDYTATAGDKLSSVNAKAAITNLTRANARVIASNRGSGWRQEDFDLMSAIQLLYLVEYASFYSQSMIGAGITNVADWAAYNDYNPIARSGNSNSIGNATGNTAGSASAATESTKYLSYRGIENLFGHLWKFIDGININDNIPYVTNNATNWADDTSTNYTQLTDILGANVTLHNADGWQNTLEQINRGFLSASVGASSSTKVTDSYYQDAGWRVVIVGGRAHDGDYAGAFCVSAGLGSGGAYQFIGGRLCF